MTANSEDSEIARLRKELKAAREELSKMKGITRQFDAGELENFWKDMKSGYWEWDNSSEFPLASAALSRMLGYDAEQQDPDFWRKHIHEEDLPKIFESFEKHVESKGEAPFDVTLRFTNTSGQTVHIWARGRVAAWSKEHNPVKVVGSVMDVSDLLQRRAVYNDLWERLNLIVAGTDSAIWDWKITEDAIWWSERHYRMLGYEPGEITPKYENFLKHVHADDVEKVTGAINDHLEKKIPYKAEFRLVRNNGELIWVEGSGQAIYDENDRPARMAGGMIDITARKNLEIKLKSQNMMFRQAEEIGRLGGWELDVSSRVLTITEQFYTIRGLEKGREYTIDEISREDPPETKRRILEGIEKVVEKGIPYDHEVQVRHTDGKLLWVHAKGVPVKDEKGKIVAIRGILQDIDAAKKRKIEFERVREKLNERIHLLRESEKVADMGSWRYDLISDKVIWSEQLYKIHKLPPEHLPTLDGVFESYPNASGEKLRKAIDEAIHDKKPYDLELSMRISTGEFITVKVRGVPVINDRGEVTALMGITQNIHKQRKQQEELRRAEYLYSEAARIGKVGAWEIDAETRAVTWSQEVYNLLDFPRDRDPELEEGINFYVSPYREEVAAAVEEALTNGTSFTMEPRVSTYRGRLIWARLTASAVYDGTGEVIAVRGNFQDITDVKNKEISLEELNEELREAEQMYSQAAQIGKVGAWKIEVPEGKVTWSEEVFKLLEIDEPFEPTLEKAFEFYLPESRKKLTEAVELTLKDGKPFSLELELRTAKGNKIWAKAEASAIRDEDGNLNLVRGLFQDITDIKERELNLQELNWELSHQRNALLHAEKIAHLGSWSYWFEDNSYTLSSQVYRIHGLEEEEVTDLKKEVYRFYDEYSEDVTRCIDCVKDKRSHTFEALITANEGSRKWVRIVCSPLLGEHGEAEGITGIVQDITDYKARERQLKDVRDQLNKQNVIMMEAKRMARIGSWQWDRDQNQLIWSDLLREIYEVPIGYEPEIDRSLQRFYDPDTADYLRKCVEDAMENETSYDFQTEVTTFTGKSKWMRIKGSPMYSEGRLCGVLGTVQDISDIKEKEVQIKKSSDLLADQNRRLMDFTQIVSHNLRSHSSNIQTMLNFVKKNNSPEEQQTYYNFIKETADSLQQAIAHLNEVVKIQKDVNLQKKEVNVEKTVREALNILEGDIRNYGVEVEVDLKVKKLRYVKAYLDSVLLNLMSNAIKYRHPERIPKVMVKTYRSKDGRPILEVSDNGQGIDLIRHGDKVFGMYKTFHKHPEARGIGLFIIKNQIEALDGKIEVESTLGEGTLFRVVF